MNHWKKAIEYVRANRTWSDARDELAFETIDRMRCPLRMADPIISDEIYDLMEEYGQDNDLPEGWWFEFGTEDDVFALI